MKKLFLILFLFICFKSFGQYPLTQNIGSDSTLLNSKGATKSRLINFNYPDTNAANLERIRLYPGAQIFTTGTNTAWLRNSTANRWLPIGSGGSDTTQRVLYYQYPLYAINDSTIAVDTGAGRSGVLYVTSRHLVDSLVAASGTAQGIPANALINNNFDTLLARSISNYGLGSRLFGFGDSFTCGSNASTDSGFVDRLQQYLGLPLTNYCQSGRGVYRAIESHDLVVNPGHTIYTSMMASFNDLRRTDTTVAITYRKTLNKIVNAHKAMFLNQYLKSYINAGGGAAAIARSGTWNLSYSAISVGGKASGCYTQFANDSIKYTFTGERTVCVALIGGDSVTYQYARGRLILYEFIVGGAVIKDTTFTENNQWDGIADGSGNDNGRGPMGFSFSGLNPNKTYRLKLISNQSTNIFAVDYFGHLVDPSTAMQMIWFDPAYMNGAGYATSPAGASNTVMNEGKRVIDSLASNITGSYPLFVANTNGFYVLATGLSGDNIHPNNTGHHQIFNAAAAVLPTPLTVPAEGSFYRVGSNAYMTLNSVPAQLNGYATFSTGIRDSLRTITADISTGKDGGQTIYGDRLAAGNLTIKSTVNTTTLGYIIFDAFAKFDGQNLRAAFGTTNLSSATLFVSGKTSILSDDLIQTALVTSQTGNVFRALDASSVTMFRISNTGAVMLGSGDHNGNYPKAAFYLFLNAGTLYNRGYDGSVYLPVSNEFSTITFKNNATTSLTSNTSGTWFMPVTPTITDTTGYYFSVMKGSDGQISKIHFPFLTGGSGTVIAANNGLTDSTNRIVLGGSLYKATTINTNSYTLRIESSNSGTVPFIASSVGTNAVGGTSVGGTGVSGETDDLNGVAGLATGIGVGVVGTAQSSGDGVQGSSLSGFGGNFTSESGTGLYSRVGPSSTNTVVNIMELGRATSGTAASGLGGAIQFTLNTTSNNRLSNRLISRWTTATDASRTSQFDIAGVNSATTETYANFQTGGIVRVNNLADTLATNAYARSVGGGGGGSSFLPVTGTGTATGNIIGDLDGNSLLITGGSDMYISINPSTSQAGISASDGTASSYVQFNGIAGDNPSFDFTTTNDAVTVTYIRADGQLQTLEIGATIFNINSTLSGSSNGYVWTLVNNATGEGEWAAAGGGGGTTWNAITDPTGTQALTFGDAELTTWANGSNTETFLAITNNSLTTGTVISSTSNSVTTGNMVSLVSTSTTLAAGNEMLDIAVSGANGTNAITATGARISVTNTNATSGTNVALDLTASGATTNNFAITAAGSIQVTSANVAQTTTASAISIAANSLTTGSAEYISSSSITTGSLVNLVSTSTATNAFGLLTINSSGANGNASRIANGGVISVTNTGTTSTNIGLSITTSGATSNYPLKLVDGVQGLGKVFTSDASGNGNWSASTAITVNSQNMTINSNLSIGNQSAANNMPAGAYVSSLSTNKLAIFPGNGSGSTSAGVYLCYYNGSTWERAIRYDNVASGGTNIYMIENATGNVVVGGTTATAQLTTSSFATAYVAKTGTYTITGTDYTVECTANTFTVTLPTAVGCAGRQYFVTNSGAGTITLGTTSSQVFVNVVATPTTLTVATLTGVVVQSNGTGWLKVSSF